MRLNKRGSVADFTIRETRLVCHGQGFPWDPPCARIDAGRHHPWQSWCFGNDSGGGGVSHESAGSKEHRCMTRAEGFKRFVSGDPNEGMDRH